MKPLLWCNERREVLAAFLIGKLRVPGSHSIHPDWRFSFLPSFFLGNFETVPLINLQVFLFYILSDSYWEKNPRYNVIQKGGELDVACKPHVRRHLRQEPHLYSWSRTNGSNTPQCLRKNKIFFPPHLVASFFLSSNTTN